MHGPFEIQYRNGCRANRRILKPERSECAWKYHNSGYCLNIIVRYSVIFRCGFRVDLRRYRRFHTSASRSGLRRQRSNSMSFRDRKYSLVPGRSFGKTLQHVPFIELVVRILPRDSRWCCGTSIIPTNVGKLIGVPTDPTEFCRKVVGTIGNHFGFRNTGTEVYRQLIFSRIRQGGKELDLMRFVTYAAWVHLKKVVRVNRCADVVTLRYLQPLS
jgi:hypothetical protein